MRGFAGLPRADLGAATTLFEPPGDGEGHWVGAPCVHRHDGTTYLTVRWRDPDRRGYELVVYRRTDVDEFGSVTRIAADDLGAVSLERAALCTDPRTGAAKLYVPVDRGENDWVVRKLDDAPSPAAFDPATARDVLVPRAGGTDAVTVKDPYVVTVGGRYYMFYAGHDGVSERAHLATSADGESWTRAATNPVIGRAGWHDHHTRVSCVVPAPDAPVWHVYYDGSGTDDHGATWNLRTGVAVADDLARPVDTTPDAPALSAPHVDPSPGLDAYGTCRYVDVVDDPDAGVDGRELFAEVARPDGAFSLCRGPLATR